MTFSVLYLGPANGTSRHRRDAFLRLGHQVLTLDPRTLLPSSPWVDRFEWHVSPTLLGSVVQRRIKGLLQGHRFDLGFVDGGSLLTRQALKALRGSVQRLICFNHDDPYGNRDRLRFSTFRSSLPEYDLVVVVRQSNVEEARKLGARKVVLFPCTADEVAHAPRAITAQTHARWACDVAFIGTWMPERGAFMVDLVKRGVPLRLFGHGWHKAPEWPVLRPHHVTHYLEGEDYAHAVQCARISIGLLSKGNRDLHTTRSMEIPSLGGLLCAERTTEHMALYSDGNEAVFWNDSAECARVCLDLLQDEPRRQRIAAAGRQRFLRNGYSSENLIRTAIGVVA